MNVSNVKNFKPQKFAEMLGVTVRTLQRWDNSGKLKAYRTPTNRRYYTYEQYLLFKNGTLSINEDSRLTIIYARVSTRNQKDDLKSQVEFLKTFCNARGMIVNEVIEDFGSGLDYNREKWNELIEKVMNNEVKEIVISNKDRFIRFGFDWFEKLCQKFNTKIIIVNNEPMSPPQELVDDIISILDVFSCRLYGLRKYKTKIKEDENIVKELQN